jgi:hypothetical protein
MILPQIGELWVESLSRQCLERNLLDPNSGTDMRFLILSEGVDRGDGVYTYIIHNFEIDQIEEIELFLGGDAYEYRRIA